MSDRFSGGLCLIFRLEVDDYHRYCYIDDGFKTENTYIKGELHTVNPIALGRYNVYKRNSREYTLIHTDHFGDVVQVEVGAMLVGRICNHHGTAAVRRGQEKGKFEFGGSTIVMLLEKGAAEIDRDILKNSSEGIETVVKYGEKIGRTAG
jgi:phosphatidylserine decarboxylase